MPFLRNAWYAAAWAHEVGENLLARRILGETILVFRATNGTAAAILDRCPHRFAPLHLGRRVGDAVECGYHGLRFAGDGSCVLNPYGKDEIPTTLRVRSFPMVERHGMLWVWMGEPARADASLIHDFAYLTASSYRSVMGSTMVKAHYELIVDNLMDTSHGQYLHKELVATGNLDPSNFNVTSDGETVRSTSRFPNVEVPPNYRPFFGNGTSRVDRILSFQWLSPSITRNRTAFVPVGETGTQGIERMGTHLLTPETETSTHYFFAHTRNFRLDDTSLDEATREWQRVGLEGQDRPMIEAVQASMLDAADSQPLRPALLAPDAAAVRARRILAKLIADEDIRVEVSPNGSGKCVQ